MTAQTHHDGHGQQATEIVGPDSRAFIRGVERGTVLLTIAGLAVVHLAYGFGPMFYGVITGCVLGLINWRVMAWLAEKTAQGSQKSRLGHGLLASVKMALLLGAIWASLSFLPISPLGFLIGISNVMLSSVFVGLTQQRGNSNNDTSRRTEERGA